MLFDLIESDASNFPWVGYIQTSFPNPTYGPGGLEIGTGSLIAPRLVLTAGHIVYDRNQGGQAVSVDITFGGPGGLRVVSAHVDFPVEWRSPTTALDANELYSPVDIGVVILDEPIHGQVTPVPFQTASDAMLTGMLLNVLGYPGYPPEGPRGTLWGNDFHLLPNLTYRMFYPVATLPGMSGGPVYNLDAVSHIRTIYGVHTSFVDGVGGCALRIDEGIYALIQHWVMTYRP